MKPYANLIIDNAFRQRRRYVDDVRAKRVHVHSAMSVRHYFVAYYAVCCSMPMIFTNRDVVAMPE